MNSLVHSKPTVLICPLDWGLGHATRCIPVIHELTRQGCEVILASSGDALLLLRQEFPSMTYIELPGYRPRYQLRGSLAMQMLSQTPRFLAAIRKEHHIIGELVGRFKVDIIISDNRYGCYHKGVRSIFIGHQIRMISLPGLSWLSSVANSGIRRFINRFDEAWIPDQPESGLATAFSAVTSCPQYYVGWLSRLNPVHDTPVKYKVLAIVSGPEPQRTVFRELLTKELRRLGTPSLLVSGEPGKAKSQMEGALHIVNHLPAIELQEAYNASEVVVARSGYSTIMDLIVTGKKAILVPTPQQTEQMSLARQLAVRKVAVTVDQDQLDLPRQLEALNECSGFGVFRMDRSLLKDNISRILNHNT